jgi:Outer membrane protein beta-barrel domain
MASAQPATDQEGIGFGIRAGLTASNVAVSAQGATVSLTSRIGLSGGGFVEIPIARNVAIQPELLLAMKGANASAPQYDETLALTYLDFPILVRFRFSIPRKDIGPYLYGGPVLGVLLTATGSSTVNGKTTDTNIKNQINSVDIGFAFGGGVQFGRLMADARYTVGFRSVFKQVQSNDIQGSATNRAISVMLGIKF